MTIALVFTAVLVFAVARPATASNRYWATGADVRIDLLAQCGHEFTYPAHTPFFISHGWAEPSWITDMPVNKQAFMGPATYFEFRIDRVPQFSTMAAIYLPGPDLQLKLFVSEFDRGLTGTHRFGALWFIDGALIGETPGVPVFFGACISYVTFT